ncbi:uncharacterized protein LOC116379919 [Anarrhichthys ocellatus]|uniref:uncharacterized protein LOC116379919 n=1 Tax=Anarrhichthys ocellatus TaxID=433405 RepID=UPI0012EE13B0|nr:uncharacterized protein LOC116379919 [Anarrhichthys ocellatus]
MADPMEVHFSVNDFTSTVSSHAGNSSSANPRDPQRHSVHAQSVEPTQRDHDYCKTGSRQDVQYKSTQYKTTQYKTTQYKMTRYDDVGYPFIDNDHKALHYIGIALDVFNILVSSLEGNTSNTFPMSLRNQVLLTLMMLKTNRDIAKLAEQFRVSESMASKIVSFWIDELEKVLQPLIPWLPKETIEATMPQAFRKHYPNTTCVLQFCQCYVQKNPNRESRGEPHVHYYDTVKFLVAVAPCGLIMFISGAYEVHSSDKSITLNSGLFDKLKAGDVFMTQHGYCSRNVSSTSHVARAIQHLKVYKILSRVVSNRMAPQINKILRICSALVNLRYDVVHASQ